MPRLYTLTPLPRGPFESVDCVSRLLFGAIYDRYKLSSYSQIGQGDSCPFYDWTRDELYCVISQAELVDLTGMSERTVRRSLTALKAAGLIDWRKATYKGANRYYIPQGIREYLAKQ